MVFQNSYNTGQKMKKTVGMEIYLTSRTSQSLNALFGMTPTGLNYKVGPRWCDSRLLNISSRRRKIHTNLGPHFSQALYMRSRPFCYMVDLFQQKSSFAKVQGRGIFRFYVGMRIEAPKMVSGLHFRSGDG